MKSESIKLNLFGREIEAGRLFRFAACISASVHLVILGVLLVNRLLPGGNAEFINSALDIRPQEIEFDIPPELIGGTSTPAPVEKQEWVEGTSKTGSDPKLEEVNTNKISGDGTDPDGYLFSFNGDKAPTPIIDFDLRQYYPKEAKEANVMEYTVTLLVQVDEKGKLVSAKIASGKAQFGFNSAAMKVVRRARFSPGYKSGKPVAMAHYLPIRFVLEN